MRTPWRLVVRHVRTHWLRSGLTVAAMVLALFLFCFVISVVTTLRGAVAEASGNRLIVQSAVSLFVNLPLSYQPKVAGVPGVADVTKFQWFGGYYKDLEGGFFAQFGVDHDRFLDMYARDLRLVEGPHGAVGQRVSLSAETAEALGLSREPDGRATLTEEAVARSVRQALAADRRAAIIGRKLREDDFFEGFRVGAVVPVIPTIFTKADGSAWDFAVVGVYEKRKANMDEKTLFFRFDYLQEVLEAEGLEGDMGTGVYSVNLQPGADPAAVSAAIDALFENGPQVTDTTTEAAFQAIFASMLGNVPAFMRSIGGAIVFAVLFSVVNTMLMAGRQRQAEAGVLKALGFRDAAVGRLLLAESLLLSLLGGALGLLLAKGLEGWLAGGLLGSFIPNYVVEGSTLAWGVVVTVGVGVLAGLGPALATARLSPVAALRSEG